MCSEIPVYKITRPATPWKRDIDFQFDCRKKVVQFVSSIPDWGVLQLVLKIQERALEHVGLCSYQHYLTVKCTTHLEIPVFDNIILFLYTYSNFQTKLSKWEVLCATFCTSLVIIFSPLSTLVDKIQCSLEHVCQQDLLFFFLSFFLSFFLFFSFVSFFCFFFSFFFFRQSDCQRPIYSAQA